MTSPLLTVNLYLFNNKSHIRACLDSILAQTFTDFKLVVSDDNSTDGSSDIVKEYAARDERIVYWPSILGFRLGAYYHFLRQHLAANTEFYVTISHDQRWAPTYLEECLRVLKADDGVLVAYSQCQYIDENGDYLDLCRDTVDLAGAQPEQRYLNAINHVGGSAAFFGVTRHAAEIKKNSTVAFFVYNKYYGYEVLSPQALAGKLIQVEEPLFFWIKTASSPTDEDIPAHYVRIFGYTNQNFPIFTYIKRKYSQLLHVDLPLELKNELMQKTVSILTAKYKLMMDHELTRAIDMVRRGDLTLGGHTVAPDGYFLKAVPPPGPHEAINFAVIYKFCAELDYVHSIRPDFPDINCARALLYKWLGRDSEAMAVLEGQLRRNPSDSHAQELKDKLPTL